MLVSDKFYGKYVKLPNNIVPLEIRENKKFYPFFKDCCAALDGSLLDAFVPRLAAS